VDVLFHQKHPGPVGGRGLPYRRQQPVHDYRRQAQAPAAGLDTRESAELGACLRGLADQGQSMLLIEHDMGLVLGICDRVVVLEFGRVIAEGPPDVVRADPRVIAAYLGDGATTGGRGGIMAATLTDEQAE
jgi:ABC-type sulfate/molybdate transport systems ATPase subunit